VQEVCRSELVVVHWVGTWLLLLLLLLWHLWAHEQDIEVVAVAAAAVCRQ
jgi:hypothetical protein